MNEFNPKNANRNKYRDSKNKKDKVRHKLNPNAKEENHKKQRDRRREQSEDEDSESDLSPRHSATNIDRTSISSRDNDESNTFTIQPDQSTSNMNGTSRYQKQNPGGKNQRDRSKKSKGGSSEGNEKQFGSKGFERTMRPFPRSGPVPMKSEAPASKPGTDKQQQQPPPPLPAIPPVNLKKETEEIKSLTQKYSKRRIVSTWSRNFDLPKYEDYEDGEEGADFGELSGASSFSVSGHFLMKEEQEWFKQAESCGSPFSLDLKCLAAGLACIPFHKRQDILENMFGPKEIQSMISEAESSELAYNDIRNSVESERSTLLTKQSADRAVLSDSGDGLIQLTTDFLLEKNIDNKIKNVLPSEEIRSSSVEHDNIHEISSRLLSSFTNALIDVNVSSKPKEIEKSNKNDEGSSVLADKIVELSISQRGTVSEKAKSIEDVSCETKGHVTNNVEFSWAPESTPGLERRNRSRGRAHDTSGESIPGLSSPETKTENSPSSSDVTTPYTAKNSEGLFEKPAVISDDKITSISEKVPEVVEKQLDVKEVRKETVLVPFKKAEVVIGKSCDKKPAIIDDDDDLNFLLGLTDQSPVANNKGDTSQQSNAIDKDLKKQSQSSGLGALPVKSPPKETDENLDDWLDSVLES